ncbi:MAG: DUF2851 family protein [Bacteroidota bacterium]
MQEAFIHFVWKHQYFDKANLVATDGTMLNVITPGFYNTDAGPDFKESKVIIDELEWRGSIEIHHRSSDWMAHKHDHDKAYDNVILHVVWRHDKEVVRHDGTQIPTLELSARVTPKLINGYKTLVNSLNAVPCAHQLPRVDEFTVNSMLEKMTVERLEDKARAVIHLHGKVGQDWEAAAFHLLCRNFGFKTNVDQFARLAELIPTKLIVKYSDNLVLLEALLFGQAGFLEHNSKDEYQSLLLKEYQFLRHKYDLHDPMSVFQWKFMRLRPSNFPTLRIAQLAAVLHHRQGLFSRIKEVPDTGDLSTLLAVQVSDYWKMHYRFGSEAKKEVPALGKSSIQNIGINTVAPLMVAYGKYVDQQLFTDRAINILEALNPEGNKITKLWGSLGVKANSAFKTQGMIQLYNNYCARKRCLNCGIGTKILYA